MVTHVCEWIKVSFGVIDGVDAKKPVENTKTTKVDACVVPVRAL